MITNEKILVLTEQEETLEPLDFSPFQLGWKTKPKALTLTHPNWKQTAGQISSRKPMQK